MAKVEIAYEFAKDDDGNIINIKNATPKTKYLCINSGCTSKLIPHFSPSKQKAWHFQHENLDFSHGGETLLHLNTKGRVKELLQEHFLNGQPIFLNYISRKTHPCIGVYNLGKTDGSLYTVQLEKAVSPEYRPDISILKGTSLDFVVEIVNTHDLDPDTLAYINKNKIKCIKIHTTERGGVYKWLQQISVLEFDYDHPHMEFLNFEDITGPFDFKEERAQKEFEELSYTLEQTMQNRRYLKDENNEQVSARKKALSTAKQEYERSVIELKSREQALLSQYEKDLLEFKKSELEIIEELKSKARMDYEDAIVFLDDERKKQKQEINALLKETEDIKEKAQNEYEATLSFLNNKIQKRWKELYDLSADQKEFLLREEQKCQNLILKIEPVQDYRAWVCYNLSNVTKCVCYYKQCEKCNMVDGAAIGLKYSMPVF